MSEKDKLPPLPEPKTESWLRDRYGAYRGHFAWRELEEAYAAGLAAARAEALRADAWQPIETAPKDGTVILVREQRCSGLAVMYLHGWKYESGNICYLEPTHWMPLPQPPAIDAATSH